MAKHTKGPWGLELIPGALGLWVIAPDSCDVAIGYCGENFATNGDGSYLITKGEAMANARLVALAPTLLEVLRELYEAFPDCEGGIITCRHGHPAIEKERAGEACRLARRVLQLADGVEDAE